MGQGAKGAGLGKLGGRGARRQVAAGRVGEEGREIFFIIKVAESLCLPSKHTFEYLIKDQLLWVLGKVIGKIHRRPWGKFVGRKINPIIIFYYTNTACLWWQKCIKMRVIIPYNQKYPPHRSRERPSKISPIQTCTFVENNCT